MEAPQTASNYARSDPVPRPSSGAPGNESGIQEKPTTVITSMAPATGPMRRSQALNIARGWRGVRSSEVGWVGAVGHRSTSAPPRAGGTNWLNAARTGSVGPGGSEALILKRSQKSGCRYETVYIILARIFNILWAGTG